MNNQEKLQQFIKDEMKHREMTLRRFSKVVNIDHATLSKIMNGKRKANINHVQKLSDSLSVDFDFLLESAGFRGAVKDELEQTWIAVQKVVNDMTDIEESISYKRVNEEISYFKTYSGTDEGRAKIRSEFDGKIEETSGVGKYTEQLKMMYRYFINDKGTLKSQLLVGAALIYFIVTTDLLPDYLLPVGLLDDAFIVQVILQRLENENILL
ncbi:transcriptional regulator [Jeotgalicoccus coquinae]|uniref:Helix-turn-helix protein n=1 Tax=Jeotgalicoccus coquinae TaxID=709509 RepID=A0A6V7R2X9_9STAP|nr:helix-turn-helix domain-containing protein [Jeotgalicoccus coquinae]MBB6423540.1 uncharacterized membrane protein YkvA (DUF1232 family) [Jeotgalicoccus coquinae]GGE20657.1 transcriptional regulator [Jeotgalicoccus coquinae]CAD2071495.1 helix-turn-helix protein [Jeotgalicoccus coquinae]